MTSPATPAPKPTLFISYASEDRAAARRLRDSLTAAGLDVWYDENELGGGDAWDAKIRRQIRECDYFMPVISANTERRKEGYFRREWRLAVERMLDMADDVMFLLPVCIDGTTEGNARVPEKFLSYQWLRATDGAATPALETLARRLAAGEHLAPTPPRGRTEPPISRPTPAAAGAPPPAAAPHEGPPPMPPFPHPQGKGLVAILKFLAELLWWIISAAWLLLRRAPKWVRAVVAVWFIFGAISFWRGSSPPPKGPIPAQKKINSVDMQAELAKARKALGSSGLPAGLTQLGDEFAKRLAAELKDSEATDKQIVAIPFHSGVTDDADTKFLSAVFTPLWGRLSIERSGQTGLISTPLPAPSDETLSTIGRKFDAAYVLGARLKRPPAPPAAPPAAPAAADPATPATAPAEATLEVVLIDSEHRTVRWSGEFPLKDADPTALANSIAEGVLAATKAR